MVFANILKAFFVLSFFLVVNIEGKAKARAEKNALQIKVQKTLVRLQTYYNFINNINNTRAPNDARMVVKKFVSDIEKISREIHRDDVCDSYYLEQLKSRVTDANLDVQSIKEDMFDVLSKLVSDTPDKYVCYVFIHIMTKIHTDLQKLLDNSSKYSKRYVLTASREYTKYAYKNISHVFDGLQRRHPKDLKRQLAIAYAGMNTQDEAKRANQLIEKIVRIALNDYREVYWTEHKLPQRLQDVTYQYRIQSADEENLQLEISELSGGILEVDWQLENNNITMEKAIKECKKYLLDGASKMEKINSISKLSPLVIYVKRMRSVADHVKSKTDIKRAFDLFNSARQYIDYHRYNASLDSYVISIKEARDNLLNMIDQVRYMGENYEPDFEFLLPQLQLDLSRLIKRKHVRGYGKINDEIQDVLDNVRDLAQNEKNYLQAMDRIAKAISQFFDMNKSL